MSVVNAAELKARFATRDRPTQKDFIDLIDTLIAGGGTITPGGPAGGALAGIYPDPSLHVEALDADDADRPITADAIQNGAVELKKLDTTGSVTNATPTRTLAGVEWLVPGTSGLTTPNVSGSIRHFTSVLTEFPNAEGVVTIDAPASFGDTPPQMVTVVAVFIDSFGGYAAGDEVTVDHFTLYDATDVKAIGVANYINAGVRRFSIRCEYGTFGAGTGLAIWGKSDVDAPPSSAALYEFAALATLQAKCQLRVYASRYENGSGFGSISAFQPASVALPADSATVTFSHNFGAMPSMETRVSLICIDADANYGEGDLVPAHLAYAINAGDGDLLNPAFAVLVGLNDIVIRRKAAAIKLPDNATGALATIDDTKWRITVEAHRVASVPTQIFPATSWEVANPAAAISYGTKIYFFNKDQGSDRRLLNKLDTTNNNLVYVTSRGTGGPWNFIPVLMRWADDLYYMVWCDTSGIHKLNLANDTITAVATGDYGTYRVLDWDLSGAATTTFPNLILTKDSYDSSNANVASHKCYKLIYNGAAYNAISGQGTIDWRLAAQSFTNGNPNDFTRYHPLTNNDNLLAVNYNRIKKRLYLTSDSNGAIFILLLNTGDIYSEWPAGAGGSAVLGAKFTLEKIVMFGACPSVWSDTSCEKFNLEYDLDTGVEVATCINRRGNTSLTGAINRFPWVE